MIEIKNVSKKFKSGESEFFALKNVSFTVPDKGITVISGPSGSGKSALLSIIGLLQTPTEGEISFDGKNTDYRNGAAVRQYIRENISYVFQEFNLVDDFSVEDNLLMVCSDRRLVTAILEKVGLSAKKQPPPGSFPAERNSVSPSEEPLPRTGTSSCSTNPPETWTRKTGEWSSSC